MTDEQQERAISFSLDLLDLVNNELVVGHWETFICKGASDILIELVKENIENVNGMTNLRTPDEPAQDTLHRGTRCLIIHSYTNTL